MTGARAVFFALALATPALGQDLPAITPEESAAAVAAVEAARLGDEAYRALWCAGSFSALHASQIAAAEPGAAQGSATARESLYREAAVVLLAAGFEEAAFTAIADDVYRVALSQMRTGGTARDFTEEECAAAATAAASPSP